MGGVNDSASPCRPEVRDLFRSVAVRLTLHWMVAAAVATGIAVAVGEDQIAGMAIWQASLVVAMATLLIAWSSLLPGMTMPVVGNGDARTRVGVFVVACVSAMAIRGGATVALVVVCRYKIAAGNPIGGEVPLASLAIGLWYVASTVDTVRMLAVGGRALDAPIAHD